MKRRRTAELTALQFPSPTLPTRGLARFIGEMVVKTESFFHAARPFAGGSRCPMKRQTTGGGRETTPSADDRLMYKRQQMNSKCTGKNSCTATSHG